MFRLSGVDLVGGTLSVCFIVEFQPNLDFTFICFLVYFLVAFFGFDGFCLFFICKATFEKLNSRLFFSIFRPVGFIFKLKKIKLQLYS